MKIHKYQGKEILRSFGVPVPRGIPAFTVQEAVEAAQKLGGLAAGRFFQHQINYNQHNADTDAGKNIIPLQIVREDTCRNRRHQSRLRGSQSLRHYEIGRASCRERV